MSKIVDFSGKRVDTSGYIDLYTKIGEGSRKCSMIKVKYLIVDANVSYNILLKRPSLTTFNIIVFISHLAMKFRQNSGRLQPSMWINKQKENVT